MLTDELDGTLTGKQQVEFEAHLASCAACAEMMADAQRGAAWLGMLRVPHLEPPPALLDRILAQTFNDIQVAPGFEFAGTRTSGVPQAAVPAAASARVFAFPKPKWRIQGWQSVSQTLLQPRLAMTAAMAFFSIGLTLNLTGVQLNKLRANDLTPSTLRRNLYQANAHVVRYYDNLRVVYELESRVREIQRISESETPSPREQKSTPEETKPEKRPVPRQGAGSSRRQLDPAPETRQSLAADLRQTRARLGCGLAKGATV